MTLQGQRRNIPDGFRADVRAGLSSSQMARKHMASKSTISKWFALVKAENPFAFPVVQVQDYNTETLHLEGDWMITSDWHLPYYEVELANHMVNVATARSIDNLVIVGDLFDFKWLSQFDIRDLHGSLRDDLAVGIHTLHTLLGWFNRIVWLMGNHEARLFRQLKWQLNLPDLVQFLVDDERVTGSTQPRAMLKSGEREYRLTHPKSYSRNAATVAATLAEKYHQNVLSAHGHLMGMKFSQSGEYIGGDLGGMFAVRYQEYLYLEGDTTHPQWVNGFWLVKDGFHEMFPFSTTNWVQAEAKT